MNMKYNIGDILWTNINSFHYLYQDAEYLHSLAKDEKYKDTFDRVRFSRTSILLYIVSLEALINRVMDNFLLGEKRKFIVEREAKFSIQDKWLLVPLLYNSEEEETFDTSNYPWSHFNELVNARNDFVHPKHDRAAFYKVTGEKKVDVIELNEIPNEIPQEYNITETKLFYRNTKIPKDPYSLLPEHIDIVKKVVDDTIDKLDELIGGQVMKDNWLTSDSLVKLEKENDSNSDGVDNK